MLKGSEKQTCVSEPYDQGSARHAGNSLFHPLSSVCSGSQNSIPTFIIWSAKARGWMSATLADETAKLLSCSQKILTSILAAVDFPLWLNGGSFYNRDDMVKEEHTQWGLSPSKQISTQGCRPDYVDYFLISASVSCVDLGYCFGSNKQNIWRQKYASVVSVC